MLHRRWWVLVLWNVWTFHYYDCSEIFLNFYKFGTELYQNFSGLFWVSVILRRVTKQFPLCILLQLHCALELHSTPSVWIESEKRNYQTPPLSFVLVSAVKILHYVCAAEGTGRQCLNLGQIQYARWKNQSNVPCSQYRHVRWQPFVSVATCHGAKIENLNIWI